MNRPWWDDFLAIICAGRCGPVIAEVEALRQQVMKLQSENQQLKAQYAWKPELASPSDIVPLAGIYHDGEGVVTVDLRKLNIEGLSSYPSVWIPEVPDTGSMDPVFDAESNNILIAGRTPEDRARIARAVKLGDIVVAHDPPGENIREGDYYVIHRVWQIGSDELGVYYVLKGDHNTTDDGVKVRPEGILWLSVGTIY